MSVARPARCRSLPLLQQRDSIETVLLVPLTGDRGLAGAFNGQVLRRAFALEQALVGRGQGGALDRSRQEGTFHADVPWPRRERCVRRFRRRAVIRRRAGDRPSRRSSSTPSEEVDRVVLVYNRFVSPLTQTVTDRDILPISPEVLESGDAESQSDGMRGDFIFEPEPEEILARLLPVYLETQIYRALLESAASFQGAQMTAMRNASKNAGELIDRVTLQMNRARQAEITQEILEVVAGAEALA